jgi:dipeptidyl aminopeptidase/acylaminoacyl peptidase
MPVDLESELARLGTAWTASVAHVEVAEVLERAMTTRSEPLAVEVFDVMTEQPAPRRGRVLVVAAVVVLLVASTVVGLVWASRPSQPSSPTPIPTAVVNGWVAFASSSPDDGFAEEDVYLVREGSSPRRITGTETDLTDEICPAFSPDGTRLAFGQATGDSQNGYSGDGTLVITDLNAEGVQTATTTIALDGAAHPPCAVWSADGRWLAFGVETPAGGPDRRIVDEVWVVDTQADDIRRLSGLTAIDLDWAPDATELAIASDGIVLYSVTADETRPLGGAGADSVAWSPDGRTIAFTRIPPGLNDSHHDLWLMDADGTDERILVPDVRAIRGLRQVWSPDGDRIAYQRQCGYQLADPGTPCLEQHEVVLITVSEDDPLEPAGTQVVIPPPQTTGPLGAIWWYPWSVTWSPDGTTLLYLAWPEAKTTLTIPESGVVAMPLDRETPPVVLSGDVGPDAYSGYPWLTIQSWGRQQDG